MERGALEAPPLREPSLTLWLEFVQAWDSGLRRDALMLADELTASLEIGVPDDRERFGWWLCERLFDHGDGWQGQFGGSLTFRDGVHLRPIEYALSVSPLVAGVVVPHLVQVCQANSGRELRWLWQALVGFKARVPPDVRSALDGALRSTCGAHAAPIDALRLAAKREVKARSMLDGVNTPA
jgi:hypothetical protein